jgi:methionyl-tRNA formyltransferase
MTNTPPISYAFFGTGALAESVLASLVRSGYIPKLVITKPDSLQGRHMQLTAPHIKTWAEIKGIPVFQPESLKGLPDNSPLHSEHFDVFIVASYGKILPEEILNLSKKGTLNVHPSLLPLYRGPSPIESALLDSAKEIGISIMKLDKEMDHGPILVQTVFVFPGDATAGTLEVSCGQLGGDLLVQVLPHYIEGTISLQEQDHSKATICKKITKDLGEITLETSIEDARSKFRALTPWPSLYFFQKHGDKNIRVKIASLDLTSPTTENMTVKNILLSVIPEGKKEMDWESFERGYLH